MELLFHLFFIICHPYIPVHFVEMIFYTCFTHFFMGQASQKTTLIYNHVYCPLITTTKYGSTLYIGMDEVFQHHAHTFEKSDLNFHFQCEFSSVAAEW